MNSVFQNFVLWFFPKRKRFARASRVAPHTVLAADRVPPCGICGAAEDQPCDPNVGLHV